MHALTFTGLQSITYESIADPHIVDSTDVIVKVNQCAICGSDLHVFYGRETGIDHHTAMGHEFAGEVVEVGQSVKTLCRGDRVMSPFTTSCGSCFYCLHGLTCRCVKSQLFGWVEQGTGLQGGQSEFVRVPLGDSTLVKIPDGITADEALLLGDIIPTGFFCAKQAALKATEKAVVVGCGPVGLMAIMGALHYGASQVIAIDSVPERRRMAQQLGALTTGDSPLQFVREHTEGRGADAVLECVGSSSAGRLAYDLLRPGGTISMVGVCTDERVSFSPVEAYNKNITFKVGRCPARHMMNELIPVVQQKKFDFSKIITHRMKLADGVRGYDIFANKKDNCLKVVLTP